MSNEECLSRFALSTVDPPLSVYISPGSYDSIDILLASGRLYGGIYVSAWLRKSTLKPFWSILIHCVPSEDIRGPFRTSAYFGGSARLRCRSTLPRLTACFVKFLSACTWKRSSYLIVFVIEPSLRPAWLLSAWMIFSAGSFTHMNCVWFLLSLFSVIFHWFYDR